MVVKKPVCDVDVKQSLSNANSDILCATCNKSMFDGVLDKCLLDLVQNGNNHAKSAKKHKKQNIWKPTGHVFNEVGFKWKPTGRTFTIVGNSCPLTRLSRLFGNDQIARIMGYGDYQHGNVIISRVYYIEGLGHNLFSVGQFCDVDLQVAFQKNTCFIRNLEGVDLLSGSRDTNLDHEDLGKFDAKADIGIFVGYAPAKKAFRIYNKRTHIITETIHVSCDELTTMASEQFSSGPGLQGMTPATSSTGLGLNPISQLPCLPPKRDDWDLICTDIAKITKKRSKPDKHEHGNG
ncbi:hypothetical protein Tco_0052382 [Tanacetum coccineum]